MAGTKVAMNQTPLHAVHDFYTVTAQAFGVLNRIITQRIDCGGEDRRRG
jgi:hypothetical protein